MEKKHKYTRSNRHTNTHTHTHKHARSRTRSHTHTHTLSPTNLNTHSRAIPYKQYHFHALKASNKADLRAQARARGPHHHSARRWYGTRAGGRSRHGTSRAGLNPILSLAFGSRIWRRRLFVGRMRLRIHRHHRTPAWTHGTYWTTHRASLKRKEGKNKRSIRSIFPRGINAFLKTINRHRQIDRNPSNKSKHGLSYPTSNCNKVYPPFYLVH